HAVPKRPPGVAIAIQPLAPVLVDIGRWRLEGWTSMILDGASVLVDLGLEVHVVVVEAPDDVATIAANVDVAGLGRKHECVDRQMRLDETPVRLPGEQLQFHGFRDNPMVEPGRHLLGVSSGSPPKSSWPTICCIQVVPAFA